jgi:hypothetical protein
MMVQVERTFVTQPPRRAPRYDPRPGCRSREYEQPGFLRPSCKALRRPGSDGHWSPDVTSWAASKNAGSAVI